jgi:hypothetical protein
MTNNDQLKTLKLLAKRYARATGRPQHVALDFVANRLGFPHWNALTGSAKAEELCPKVGDGVIRRLG